MMRKTIIGSSILVLILANLSPALTLKESIDLALKNNPSVVASQKKLEASEARLGQAVGAFFPTIKIDGNIGRTYSQPAMTQMTITTSQGSVTQRNTFGPDMIADTKSITTSLSQPIFVGGLFPGLKIANASADLAREELRRSILETSFNVTQSYFGVLRAEKIIKLSEQSKEMAQQHFNQVKALLSAGSATRSDLLRTEVRLANSEVALTKAQNALEIAKDAFNNALGRNMDEEAKITEETYAAQFPKLPDYNYLINIAFQNRPDWKQFLQNKQIGEENVALARTAYLPSVMLTGSTGNRITEFPIYKTDVNSWSLIGVASWTIFDGLSTHNRIREAAANLEAQKASEDGVKNGIALEVRDAYFNLKSVSEAIGPAQKAVESAEENYKVSDLRYRSGVGTNLEVIDAQVILTQARIDYFQAVFDLQIAKAKINKAVGKEVF